MTDDRLGAGAPTANTRVPCAESAPAGVSPKFWRLLVAEPLRRHAVLDVGTGSGRLALALAPHCGSVLGIDRDPAVIDEARRRARAAGLRNVEFLVADAERIEYDGRSLPIAPTMVTAHLYLSRELIDASSRALPDGGVLAFVGFHADQWRETGRRSRFAWDGDVAAAALGEGGFVIAHLEVDAELKTFGSVEEALAAVVGLEERWRQDGRWFRYIEYLERGGRSLTRSHLIGKARRRR
ncbi:MAG: class I SAM-dependent methyltransferase [Candidatus Rokuibacteriota bacterium]